MADPRSRRRARPLRSSSQLRACVSTLAAAIALVAASSAHADDDAADGQERAGDAQREQDGADAQSDSGSPRALRGTARLLDREYEVGVFGGFGGVLSSSGLVETPGFVGVRFFENHGYVYEGLAREIAHLVTTGKLGAPPMDGEPCPYLCPWVDVSIYSAGAQAFAGLHPTEHGTEVAIGVGAAIGHIHRLPIVLQIGDYTTSVRSTSMATTPGSEADRELLLDAPRAGQPAIAHHGVLRHYGGGFTARIHVPITAAFNAYAEWDANLLAVLRRGDSPQGLYTSPLRVGLRYDFVKGYARATATLNGFDAGAVGSAFEVGFFL